jgi:hypothetical protein
VAARARRTIAQQPTNLVYLGLEPTPDGTVSRDHFRKKLCSLLRELHFEAVQHDTCIGRLCPTFWQQPCFARLKRVVSRRAIALLTAPEAHLTAPAARDTPERN